MKKQICLQIYIHAFLAVLTLFSSPLVAAQTPTQKTDSPAAARMRALNNSLLRLHGQMQQARPTNVALLRNQAATVVPQRATALSKLIESEPQAALSFAFSPEVLADLAAKFPNVSAQLESHTTLTGPVERWIFDNADLKGSSSLLQMRVGQQRVSLYFARREPAHLLNSNIVHATGVLLGHEMAVANVVVTPATTSGSTSSHMATAILSGATSILREQRWPISLTLLVAIAILMTVRGLKSFVGKTREYMKHVAVYGLAFAVFISGCSELSAAASICSTTGAQNTAGLLVSFQDIAVGVTPQEASDVFFDTNTGRSLNGFWQEASYSRASAAGSVFGPYTLGPSSSYTCANAVQVFYDAVTAAAAAGVHLQNYSRINVVLPSLSCGWAGFTITGSAGAGCNLWTTSDGPLTASLSYEVDSYFTQATYPWATARDQAVALVSHESGHQLGLSHSGTITDQPTSVVGPITAPGAHTEYGDDFSVMSVNNLGLYPASHKAEVLNWMTAGSNYQVVQSGGTYTLQPLELSTPGLQALKVQRGTGNPGYYLWVEYRQPIGAYDSTLPSQPFSGALIHYEDPTTGAYTNLLDFTPGDTLKTSPALLAGQTWADPYSNLSISALSATASALTVSVNYGAASCTQANPTVTLTPSDPSIYPGGSATYTVSVLDNDSAACSASTFNMGSAQPSGWQTSFSPTSVTLTPGQSAPVTMTKTGPSSTLPGTYAVNANASNNSYLGSGPANATVMSAPTTTVTVSVPSSSYTRRSTVPITATVLNGGTPASGASVIFTMIRADGSTVTQSATTGSKGTAAWSYKLNPKAPTGTYSVTAQATLSSTGAAGMQPVISNTATFSVQ
jgi:M6 family metalloprotease-like protein